MAHIQLQLTFFLISFCETNRDNTYEPEDNLNCPEILQAFLEKHERESNKKKNKDKYEKQEEDSSSKKHKNKGKQKLSVSFVLTDDMTDSNEKDETSNKKNETEGKKKELEANRERDTATNKEKGKESEALQAISSDSGYANQQQRRSQDEQDRQQSKKIYSNQSFYSSSSPSPSPSSSSYKSNNIPAKVSCVFFLLLQTFLISYLFFIFNN